MTNAPHLALDRVSLALGGRPVLGGIDLVARRGEVVVVLGPSGCGKTSLLRLIAGLLRPDAGSVRVGGAEPVPGRAAAMVFQSYRLLPWKTVRGNVAFALPHLDAAEREARVARVLGLVGLTRPELEAAQAWLHSGEDFAGVAPAPLNAWTDLAPLEAVLARIGPVEESDVPTR